MRTLRLSLVGTVILALIGGQGGPVLAQEDSAAFVTGTVSCKPTNEWTRRAGDGIDLIDIESRCSFEMSDPRVSGFMLADAQTACFEEAGDACVGAGTIEIVPGPDGKWVGPWASVHDPTITSQPVFATMQGTGIYEGWTYFLHSPDRDESDAVSGVIFEGPPPPWKVSLPLEPAE